MKKMTNKKRNVVLADCEESEVKSLIKGIQQNGEFDFTCESTISNGIRKGIWSDISRYFMYFLTPWRIFLHRKQYGVIIGWQQFYALIFCFYCSLFHVKKANTVIVLNFTYKNKGNGLVGWIYHLFIRRCVCEKYIDYIHVISNNYAYYVSKEFDFPLDRIIASPFGIDDQFDRWNQVSAPVDFEKNGYALAIGRSNRDYDFLLSAWNEIDFPLVLISDTYQPNGYVPQNVYVVNNVAGDAQYPWLVNSRMVILPIQDGAICSGDTVLLTAMSFQKTVIVTSPSTLGEMYIKNSVNGYLVHKDKEEFIAVIRNILCGDYPDCGENARSDFLLFYTRTLMGEQIANCLTKRGEVPCWKKS